MGCRWIVTRASLSHTRIDTSPTLMGSIVYSSRESTLGCGMSRPLCDKFGSSLSGEPQNQCIITQRHKGNISPVSLGSKTLANCQNGRETYSQDTNSGVQHFAGRLLVTETPQHTYRGANPYIENAHFSSQEYQTFLYCLTDNRLVIIDLVYVPYGLRMVCDDKCKSEFFV